MLPDIHVRVDDRAVPAQDVKWDEASGYDTASMAVTADSARELPDEMGQGSEVTIYCGGSVRWQGRLVTNPYINEGIATVSAVGHKADAEEATDTLCYQAAGTGYWTELEGDPHNYSTNTAKIVVNIGPGRMKFLVPVGTALVVDDRNGACMWLQDNPGELTWVAGTIAGDVSVNNVMRVTRATGPSGARSSELDVTGTGPFTRVLGTPSDLIALEFIRQSSGATAGTNLRHVITNLRVNGRADARNGDRDIFYQSDVFDDLCSLLGWDSSGVSGNILNILPLLWDQGSYDDLMHYMGVLKNSWHRVLDDRGSGPYLETGDWANSKVWIFQKNKGAIVETPPLQKYNRATVHGILVSGKTFQRSAFADVSELDDRGLIKRYPVELSDPQKDTSLASTVAASTVAHVSQERREGTIRFVTCFDEDSGLEDPYGPLSGDIARLADDDSGKYFDYRITGVAYDKDGGTLQVGGDWPPADRIVGKFDLIRARKRKPYRRLKRGIVYTDPARQKQFKAYQNGWYQNWDTASQMFGAYNWFRRSQGKRQLTWEQYKWRFEKGRL